MFITEEFLVILDCEMSKIPHFLDSRLIDGGEFVSLIHCPRSNPTKHFISLSGTWLC
jgi:hypothetical protein